MCRHRHDIGKQGGGISVRYRRARYRHGIGCRYGTDIAVSAADMFCCFGLAVINLRFIPQLGKKRSVMNGNSIREKSGNFKILNLRQRLRTIIHIIGEFSLSAWFWFVLKIKERHNQFKLHRQRSTVSLAVCHPSGTSTVALWHLTTNNCAG